MAKGRMVSKSIDYDPAFNKLSLQSQLLFLRAIPHLDRDGLAPGEPVVLWGRIAPLCPQLREHMEQALADWAESGLVERYTTDMGPVIWFTGFARNQVGMVYEREGASIYPPPPGYRRTAKGMEKLQADEVIYEADTPLPAPPGESASHEPLAKQFQLLLDQLRESSNKTGKLGEIYQLCFGEVPNFSRIGKVAKDIGGAGRLAQLFWQLTADRPSGDVLSYIQRTHAAQQKQRKGAVNGAVNGNGQEHKNDATEPDSEFLARFRSAQRVGAAAD